MSEIKENQSNSSGCGYTAYALLHIFLGFPLTALVGAAVLDVINWLQKGSYQGLVFWLLFAAVLTFIIWLPAGLIFGSLMGHIAGKFRWKRNRYGVACSVLVSAAVYAMSWTGMLFCIYALDNSAKFFKELDLVISQAMLFGVFAGVVGGLFAWALPREQTGDADDDDTP